MGANSTQGWSVTIFLLAFTCLAGAFFSGGNILLMLLFLVGLGASLALSMKAKASE